MGPTRMLQSHLPISGLFVYKDFIYLFMRHTHTHTHTHTQAETQAEGEAGSMQGA